MANNHYKMVIMPNNVLGKSVINYIVEEYEFYYKLVGGVASRNGSYHEQPKIKEVMGIKPIWTKIVSAERLGKFIEIMSGHDYVEIEYIK